MERRFKTQDEFIESVMQGDKWELNDIHYYYDASFNNPFRFDGRDLNGCWDKITTEEFTLVEPEPVYEERWMMLKDNVDVTVFTNFCNQKVIDARYPKLEGWYKGQAIKVKVNK